MVHYVNLFGPHHLVSNVFMAVRTLRVDGMRGFIQVTNALGARWHWRVIEIKTYQQIASGFETNEIAAIGRAVNLMHRLRDARANQYFRERMNSGAMKKKTRPPK